MAGAPSTISFVYSNPRHHAEMMAPVMAELALRGASVRAISLAELRGFATGSLPGAGLDEVEVHRVVPLGLRKDPSMGASFGTTEGSGKARSVRRAAQLAVWGTWLAPRLAWLLRGSDAVVVPNDAAYPYRELARLVRLLRMPLVLMQEGIRFPLPGVREADAYGRGGAAVVCAWGQASAEYFRGQGAPPESIHVTGNPRFDRFDPAAWREQGAALLASLGIARPPLLYLSNPIDDQGFCTTREKMDLFRRFADGAAGALAAKGRHLVVKLHPREDVEAFRRAARESGAAARTHVLSLEHSLFAALAGAGAAVVLASTVGLEALLFDLPLGVLEVPGAGFVFDYVQGGAARGLRLEAGLGDAVAELLAEGEARAPVPSIYLERHLAHRGSAARRVAGLIEEVAAVGEVTAARAEGARRRSES
jgi:hypothetical protein